MVQHSRTTGAHYETLALVYLKKQGLVLLQQNFRASFGEIDLIMRDKDTVVFVEVRQRSSSSHGNSLDSITRYKQDKIARTALHYLQRYRLIDSCFCRFDVVAIDQHNVTWIKDAFQFNAH